MNYGMWMIGDIHGCAETLKALVSQLDCSFDQITVCGDLVDRGPKSKEVVQYIIDNKIKCVRGNHEQMMLDDLNKNTKYPGSWEQNGGDKTYNSYKDPLTGEVRQELLDEHLKFLNTLPYYIKYPLIFNDDGRYLVVSHASVGSTWHFKDKVHKNHMFEQNAMWNRTAPYDVPEIYNVIGHSPIEEPRITKIYANIDTGCIYKGYKKFGKLTALHFPSMKIIQQDNIDV